MKNTKFMILYFNAGATESKSNNSVWEEKKHIEIIKGNIYTTLPHLGKDYLVSFDVKATSFIGSWQSIVHFTTGGNMKKYGSRTPAIFFNSKRKLHITSAINGNKNYYWNDPVQRKENEWINIQISQHITDGVYVYEIRINGNSVHSVKNNKPQDFNNVKVYISDPWYFKLNGFIHNLAIRENGKF